MATTSLMIYRVLQYDCPSRVRPSNTRLSKSPLHYFVVHLYSNCTFWYGRQHIIAREDYMMRLIDQAIVMYFADQLCFNSYTRLKAPAPSKNNPSVMIVPQYFAVQFCFNKLDYLRSITYQIGLCRSTYQTRATSDCLIHPFPASLNVLLDNCA